MGSTARKVAGGLIVTAVVALTACGAHSTAADQPRARASVRDSAGSTMISDVFGGGCDQLPPAGHAGSLTTMAHQSAAVAIASNPVLSDFAAALRSTPTDTRLNGDRGLTVFAPDNDAFEKLHRGIGDDAFAHLRSAYDQGSFLPHLIVTQRLSRASLTAAGSVEVDDGDKVTIAGGGPTITVADAGLPPAHVVCGNIPTANATVFIIDTVLMSPGSQLAHTSPQRTVHCAPDPRAHDDAVLCFDAHPILDPQSPTATPGGKHSGY